ncbi:MAG: glutamate--cysteine ligase [Rhodospirillales bacterium]
MSAPPTASGEIIRDKRQFIEHLASGEKPKADWRIGTEHEKFGFIKETLQPMPYEGPHGIRAMLEGLTRYGWQPVLENNNPIALAREGGSVSLEPGGQLELSGAPVETIHDTCTEVHRHLAEVKKVAEELGVAFLGMGFAPTWKRSDMIWMPKGRYKIMGDYMPKVGTLGLDMMLRTCTVQVNLDYSSEADMVKKFRVSLALQPLATALFADSPFYEGKPSGYLSYRSHIWTDTDPDRTGVLPFVFEDGMSYERYVDYMLDVPMYFVYRDGKYVDASGQSFRDFLKGKLPARPGELPTISDWSDHMTTAFPEVRLKKFLEMRGADGGPWARLCALPTFWVGLLYDQAALDAAWDIVKDWTAEEHAFLRREVPKRALKTEFQGKLLSVLAQQVLKIARSGLAARQRLDAGGSDETGFLNVLDQIAETGETPAEHKLALYNGRWQGDLKPLFKEFAY